MLCSPCIYVNTYLGKNAINYIHQVHHFYSTTHINFLEITFPEVSCFCLALASHYSFSTYNRNTYLFKLHQRNSPPAANRTLQGKPGKNGLPLKGCVTWWQHQADCQKRKQKSLNLNPIIFSGSPLKDTK